MAKYASKTTKGDAKRKLTHNAARRSRLPLCERLELRQLLAAMGMEQPTLGFWMRFDQLPDPLVHEVSYLNTTRHSAWGLDRQEMAGSLFEAPSELADDSRPAPFFLLLPRPDGHLERFNVVKAPIMEPELAAEFPEIQTYRGSSVDNPAATLRFDVSPYGFHAQVLAPDESYYIDPYWHNSDRAYVSYFKRDLLPRPDHVRFEASALQGQPTQRIVPAVEDQQPSLLSKLKPQEPEVTTQGISSRKGEGPEYAGRSGAQLRTYRLANAATGEYTQFHGGTVAAGQAAIVTTINRVVGIYEKELAVRMVLVANNSSLVYTNPNTDPYSNNDGGALISQNQSNIDSVIGNANYDIGHVFSTGGGGLAALGVVGVTGQKARGQTGSGAPIGDPFDVDYVAHEIGHQFGGNHTFNGTNGSCGGNRSASAAFETGSGSTIMGYAGICGADNLQLNSDPYFHSRSFDEIVQYATTGAGNSAATITSTGNNVPKVYAGKDYQIPAATPFEIDAFGFDVDSNNVLTFNWEQRDLGAARALSDPDNGTSPLFRSWSPTTSTTRTFPRPSALVNNTTPPGERLPTTNRSLNFRAVVRDNFGGGGGANTDDMRITVVNTGSSFAVTSPNSQASFAAGSQQTVTWNTASTAVAPINESFVDIWLSVDGGLTYPVLLAGKTANDGSHTVEMPSITTNSARVKVAAHDGIFFDISNTNFSITSGGNRLPSISNIANQWIPWNTVTSDLALQISDVETSANDLVVTAFAANESLIPSSRIEISGTGQSRSLRIRPALGEYGETKVFVGVTDASGDTVYETFRIYVEPSLVCQAMQSFDAVNAPALPEGWTSTSAAGSVLWATSTTSSHTGANNAFIVNSNVVTDTRLTTPVIPAAANVSAIRFQNSYNLESGYDGGTLEIAIGGNEFVDFIAAGGLFATGGYNSVLSSSYSNPMGGRSAWSGNSNGYLLTTAQFPPAAIGNSVQLRWRLATDSSVSAPGWRVDTVDQCGFIPPPILAIEAVDSVKSEGNSGTTPFVFKVHRRGDLSQQTTVDYVVSGIGDNPAEEGDFQGGYPSGTVTFPINATEATVTILVNGDLLEEASEGFRISLSNPSATALIDIDESFGTILNDDLDNSPPTDIVLSSNTIAENRANQASIGTFSSQDSNESDSHSYAFVSGAGDADNALFALDGNSLLSNVVFNFENRSSYSIRIRSTDQGGLSTEKQFQIQVVDLPELVGVPILGDGTVQRSNVTEITVTFEGDVTIGDDAFELIKRANGGGPVTLLSSKSTNGAGFTEVLLTFSGEYTRGLGNALTDGNYQLSLRGDRLTRDGRGLDSNQDGIDGDQYVIGTTEADRFYSLYGDVEGDRVVGLSDFNSFRRAFGKSTGDSEFDPDFDFDGNGTIALSDFNAFRTRFGQRLNFE